MDNLTYYREVQGVMTRFEPLTDAALQATAEDGLTVSEIKSALERHGLDAKHVVHDPSRALFSTYYADFDHGLYGEIFLQRNLLEGTLPLYAVASRLNGGTVPQLVSRQWVSYYTKCVPLPMLIYDFQRRYLDIPTEEVFSTSRQQRFFTSGTVFISGLTTPMGCGGRRCWTMCSLMRLYRSIRCQARTA